MKLFQPFTQADGSTTRKYGGTGLGLAISKQLVEAMNGTIGVSSDSGQGSCFSVKLWFERAEHFVDAQKDSPLLQGLRICCVDDNQTTRMMLYHYAHTWGMDPVLAENGVQALTILREQTRQGSPCDLAVLDMDMPHMNGMELTQAIKADPELENLPLVLLTSSRLQGYLARSPEMSVEVYLSKPVRKRDLQMSLEAVVARLKGYEVPGSVVVIKPSASEGVSPQSASGHILVVDDHVVNQQLAQMMLERLGHRIDVAQNGLEAVEAVKQISYDLIFMDCHMPEMDGYDATRAIRKWENERTEAERPSKTPAHLSSRTPIVAMTANAMKGDQEKCLAAGMDDYMSKPIKHEELAILMAKWLPVQAHAEVPIENGMLVSHHQDRDGLRESAIDDLSLCKNDVKAFESILSVELVKEWWATGGHAFIAKLVDQFVCDAVACVTRIQTALDSQSASDVLEAAHGLKGMAANMGFIQLAKTAHHMEMLGRHHNLLDAPSVFDSVQKEFVRVQEALQDVLNQEELHFQ